MSNPNDDVLQRFPSPWNQVSDIPSQSNDLAGQPLDHTGHPTSSESQQRQRYPQVPSSATPQVSGPSTNIQTSGLFAHPTPSEDPLAIPQAAIPQSPVVANHQDALTQQSAPLQGPPPYATLGHYPAYPNLQNLSLAQLPYQISCIGQAKLQDFLGIAVVRHRDIYDMVETEYGRVMKEAQQKLAEDASVLSFVKDHKQVHGILYQEFEDLPNLKKHETVQTAFTTINQIISRIALRVRSTSNWRTKFNAFLTLSWIGQGIVVARGALPNAIRAHMALDSNLVEAMDNVYATMGEAEIRLDGLRLMEALVYLNRDRNLCFNGLDNILYGFRRILFEGVAPDELN